MPKRGGVLGDRVGHANGSSCVHGRVGRERVTFRLVALSQMARCCLDLWLWATFGWGLAEQKLFGQQHSATACNMFEQQQCCCAPECVVQR